MGLVSCKATYVFRMAFPLSLLKLSTDLGKLCHLAPVPFPPYTHIHPLPPSPPTHLFRVPMAENCAILLQDGMSARPALSPPYGAQGFHPLYGTVGHSLSTSAISGRPPFHHVTISLSLSERLHPECGSF